MSQKLFVNYCGEEYEAHYSTAPGFVEVEIFWGANFHRKTTRPLGMGNAEVLAKIIALEILKGAKERGELS